jgi:hypothetical protein
MRNAAAAAAACMPVHACPHAGPCMPVHSCSMQHACSDAYRFMHPGSCMPVHACRFMPAAAGACVRACARCAYCQKCRVNLGSKRSGWSNISDLINMVIVQLSVRVLHTHECTHTRVSPILNLA